MPDSTTANDLNYSELQCERDPLLRSHVRYILNYITALSYFIFTLRHLFIANELGIDV